VEIPFLLYLPVAVLFSLFTPLTALIINVLASNKVQGFAVMKTLGGVFLLPLFALFITEGWKYVFGLLPNFWTFMPLDKALTTGVHDYLHLGIGFVVNLTFIVVLFRIFNKKY
jgi:fluoroquinolone transport system permease protein